MMKLRLPSRVLSILPGLFLFTIARAQESERVARYNPVFLTPPQQVPTAKTPDAPLAGNGDIGLTMGGRPDSLVFYFGKNDFWRAYPVYPGGGIALPGGLSISLPDLAGSSWYARQQLDSGQVRGLFRKKDTVLDLKAMVTATANVVLIRLTAGKTMRARLRLWPANGNTSVTHSGHAGKVYWVSRSFEGSPLLEWPCHVALAMGVMGEGESGGVVPGDALSGNSWPFLPAGKTVTIAVTIYTNFDRKDWKQDAIQDAAGLTPARISRMEAAHADWWKQFWNSSAVEIGDSLLEKYYYGSQYLFAAASRGNKFAPGIWGPFITRDSTAWGGDYHLNYNYQAPYWASYSSNHLDQTENYDQPLLDYMEKGREHARSLLHVRGIYYPVGIGPHGLCTTRWPLTPEEMLKRYGTTDNTIDQGYKFLGQKINAVFGAANMFMRFYHTWDPAYALRVYPYLLACADFWEDYLRLENGRYVIRMDHFYEIMPNLRNQGHYKEHLGDVNSTLSLGLVQMLFRGMLDVSRFLQRDSARRKKWTEICTHLSAFPVGEANGIRHLKDKELGPGGREVAANGLSRVSIHGLILPGAVVGPYSDPSLNTILLGDIAGWKDRMEGKGDWGNTLGNGIETCFPAAVRVGYDPAAIRKYLKERIAAESLPNLWVTQSGGGVETLAAVPLTINEMLLQSYEGVLRIFPVRDWPAGARFDRLRAYGAFVISSRLREGKVEEVRLLSEKGRPCRMENPWPGHSVLLWRDGKKVGSLSGGILEFPTGRMEAIRLECKD